MTELAFELRVLADTDDLAGTVAYVRDHTDWEQKLPDYTHFAGMKLLWTDEAPQARYDEERDRWVNGKGTP